MSRYPLKYLPIDEMHVSKLNMRHGRKAPNTDDIYPSVLKSGVLKPLAVRREGEGWGVVAGRRRLFALRRKEKETGKREASPLASDRTIARIAALNRGIYSSALHETDDPSANKAFIEAHKRRLEALRRAGLVMREGLSHHDGECPVRGRL